MGSYSVGTDIRYDGPKVEILPRQPHNFLILNHFMILRARRNSSDMSADYWPCITMVRFQRRKTAA